MDEKEVLMETILTEIKPNDIILINLKAKLAQDNIAKISNYIQKNFPNNKLIMVGPECDFHILRKTDDNVDPRDIELDKDLFGEEETENV